MLWIDKYVLIQSVSFVQEKANIISIHPLMFRLTYQRNNISDDLIFLVIGLLAISLRNLRSISLKIVFFAIFDLHIS